MRIAVRILILFFAVVMAVLPSSLEQVEWLKEHTELRIDKTYSVIFPALSPLMGVFSSIAARAVEWIILLGIPVLAMSVLKGRWFCRYGCPMGLIVELTAKLRLPALSRIKPLPLINRYLLAFMFGSAVFGYPLFLWLDPLSIFCGFVSVWHMPITLISLLPAAGFITIVILSFVHPANWCFRICPLGYLQEFLRWLTTTANRLLGSDNAQTGVGAPAAIDATMSRYGFLTSLMGGMAGVAVVAGKSSHNHIRPPGAVEENKFTAMCARCGNCVAVCPAKVLHHDWTGRTGWDGWMTPILIIEPDYCYEWCNDCAKVCPTHAIRRVAVDDKKRISIGTAEVLKDKCIAFHDREYCVVCQEHCPYGAVKLQKEKGVQCPVVNEKKCRGCGICQKTCPALTKAIVIRGHEQRELND